MYKVNEVFSIKKDKYNWILIELREGKDKETGESKKQPHETYYPTLEATCYSLLDKAIEGSCMEEIIDSFNKAKRDIKDSLEEIIAKNN